MNKENQAIIKALKMYGRVPEQWELLNEIERLNKIINKAKERTIYLQERYGYILDDLTFLLMQGSDKE